MISSIIDICIAKKVNEYLKMPYNLLYLGSIAPNLNKELNKSDKEAHFCDELGNIQLDKFIEKYQYKMWYPYVMGYFIHLYTDKVWNEEFILDFIENGNIKLMQGKMSVSSKDIIDKLIYEDCTNLVTTLIDHYEIKLALFYDDLILPKVIIDEIDTSKLDILVNKVSVVISNAKKEKPFIFDWSILIKFIDRVSLDIIDYIKKFDL